MDTAVSTYQDDYVQLLESKIKIAEKHGFSIDPSLLHPSTKPHQRDIIQWALELGAALIAPDCGTGKSHMAIESLRMIHLREGGTYLIVTELGASDTFCSPDPAIGEGARLGVPIDYVTNDAEAFASACYIVVTNYERVRMGGFNFSLYQGVWLDEGNYIKNPASETTNALQVQLKPVKYKFVATATPNPNRTLELVNYAHILGICDRGQILTRFFQRNSTKAGDLTLHPQHEEDFWMWVYSWMVSIEKPSDMGYDDEGYALPKLTINWHEVKLDKTLEGKFNRDGQKEMFIEASADLGDKARIKRESIDVRVNKALEIVAVGPEDHFLIWHLLEDERKALKYAFKEHPSYGEVYGSQDWKIREATTVAFIKGQLQILATKPDLSGVGVNFQKHCHRNIVMSINHDFDALYQLIKRTHRYPQTEEVIVDVVYVAEEHDIVADIKEKWRLHNEQRAKLRSIVLKYGLSHSKFIEEKRRSFHINRKEYAGQNYKLINGDCVQVYRDQPDNCVDLFNTSFPFGNHYEYTDKYNDFGHNEDLKAFQRQLDFLIPEMLRVLKPGRIAAVHLKNRIHYGSVTGLGFSVFHRFTHAMCDSMEKHGFQTMGFHYIPTDVVAENNQTYRLGYSEMKKDATKMGSGIPEEIWLFRKPPSSNANAYADEPVMKNICRCPHCGHNNSKDEFDRPRTFLKYCKSCKTFMHAEELIGYPEHDDYSLARWQIDADSHWHTSGNRLLTPNELKRWGIDKIQAWWKQFNKETIYDYDAHIELLEALNEVGKLSKLFTTLPMQSTTDYVWNDVNRMHGLNLEQSRRKQQNHICPQPFDEADRIIELYSNPELVINGEWHRERVDDPFTGLGTTLLRAIIKGRSAFGSELNEVYAKCAAAYLREAEMKRNIPSLFDMMREAV